MLGLRLSFDCSIERYFGGAKGFFFFLTPPFSGSGKGEGGRR